MNLRIAPALLFCIFTLCFNLNAATLPIKLSVRQIDDSKMPNLTCEIQAKQGSNVIDIPIESTSPNVFIYEDNYVIGANVISKTADNWYKINWVPNHNILEFDYNANIRVNIPSSDLNNRYVGDSSIVINAIRNSKVIIKYNNDASVEDIYFYDVEVNKKAIRQIDVVAFKSKMNSNGFEIPLKIDSITIDSPYFTWEWQLGNRFPAPPTSILGSFSNLVDLYFTAPDNKSHTATLAIHYEGGAKKLVRLYGNKYSMEGKNLLTLLFPNGKEKFAPCQEVEVRWKGNNKSNPTIAEYTTNNGSSWQSIGKSSDTTIKWVVPKTITDNVKVRVRQELVSNEPVALENSKVYTDVEYSPKGNKVLIITATNDIEEWNPGGGFKEFIYSKSQAQSKLINAVYMDNDSFAVASRYGNKTLIDIFIANTAAPVRTLEFSDYNVSAIQYNNELNEFMLFAENLWICQSISSTDGEHRRQITTNSFFSTMRKQLNIPKLQVASVWKNVDLYSSTDYDNVLEKFDMSEFPTITHIAISPDKTMIAFACKGGLSQKTRVYVYDLLTQKLIFRPITNLSSNIIGLNFSANSTMLAIGHDAYPQINIVDIINQKVVELSSGNSSSMIDFTFSTDANEMVYSSGSTLYYRSFSYPEVDASDTLFSIIQPKVEFDIAEAGSELMFDDHKKTATKKICNVGEVPLKLDENTFTIGKHFKIETNQLPQTVNPGECIDLKYIFHPKDIGLVNDTLVFNTCSYEYRMPFSGTGIERNISFSQKPFSMGESCIGDTLVKKYVLIKNEDPTDVIINKIDISSKTPGIFRIKKVISDYLLKADSTLVVEILGVPDTLGIIKGSINVQYANQTKYKKIGEIEIKGIGTYVELSHNKLAFIKEIRERKITVKNIGVDPVFVNNLNAFPEGRFKVNTIFPLTILPGETKEFAIEWIGDIIEAGAYLAFDATPCLVQRYIPVSEYSANLTVKIENTDVDALDSASINVSISGTENIPYKGIRKFVMDFVMNKRIFFPQSAVSTYGNAKVSTLSTDVNDRIIRLEIEGDFGVTGKLATIKGLPGLCETFTSPMTLEIESDFFGASAKVSTQNGMFTVLSDCINRRIIQITPELSIKTISPNPANGLVSVEYSKQDNSEVFASIFDNLGNEIISQRIDGAKDGNNTFIISVDKIPVGTYLLVISNSYSKDSKELIIIR